MRSSCTTSVPMPKIMRRARSARFDHQALHLRHCARHAVDQRARDDGVSDVQLDDLADRGDRLHVVIVHAMAGVHGQPEAARVPGRIAEPLQLARLTLAARVGIRARVQLDDRRTDTRRRFELRRIRIDEQRDADARIARAARHTGAERCDLRCRVEAAFGRHLGATLGHQAAVRRPHFAGDAHHFFGRRHLEVQPRLQHLAARREYRGPGCAGDPRADAW